MITEARRALRKTIPAKFNCVYRWHSCWRLVAIGLALLSQGSNPCVKFAWSQVVGEPELILNLADGRVPGARLVDIASDGRLVFQAAGESQPQALTDIVRWGKERATIGGDLIWLNDGSWLAGQIRWKSDRAFELITDWFETIDFELEQVRGLILQPPIGSKGFYDLEKRMRGASGAADSVWNNHSEQLSGVLSLQLRQSVDSSRAQVPVWSLKAAGAAAKSELDIANLQAIVLSPVLRRPLRESPDTVRIDLRDGSRLNVSALQRNVDGRITVLLADQRKLQAVDMSSQFVPAITRIAGDPQSVTWLSALEPARVKFMHDDQELTWPLGRDQDLFGKPLFVEGDHVRHGLVLHAPAQVAYRWDGRRAKFLADVQLVPPNSDWSTDIGSVECKLLVARKGELVELFKSPTLRASSRAVPVEVDISDAQLVVLLAEESDQGPIGDHVLWRDARLVP